MTLLTSRALIGPASGERSNFVWALHVQGTMRILLIALLAVAALPAAADAATVSRTGGTLRYEAGKGERVSWEITETTGGAFLTRTAKRVHQRLIPGAGCKRSRAREIRCAGQGVARVVISLKRARTSAVALRDIRVAVESGVPRAGG